MRKYFLNLIILLLAGLVNLGLVDDAHAQRRRGDDRRESSREDRREDRRGDRRGDRRDDDDNREERRRPTNEERRQWYLRRMDDNNDGVIERSEVDSDRSWRWFEESARKAGLDPSKPVKIDSYLSARRKQDRAEYRSENPTAFLPPLEDRKAAGFDTPLTETELAMLHPDKPRGARTVDDQSNVREEKRANGRDSSRERGRRSGGDREAKGLSEKAREYAKDLMKKYDKDGNSTISGNEYESMSSAEKYDLNKDKKITLDELEKRARGDGSEKSRSSNRFGRGERDRGSADDKEDRGSYRFTSALERLPDDARRWVERYDDNGDGQVAMSEFSSSWSERKVSEFQEIDTNGDGVVTGEEYLESKQR